MKYHPKSEVTINAPIADVWRLLENFDDYARWNTMITFKGKPKVGKKTPMKVSIMGRAIVTPVKFLKIEKETELRWRGGPAGLFTGEHYFKLESMDDKTTRMIQGEIFKGIAVPFLFPFLNKTLNTLYEKTNIDIVNALS